MTIDDYNANILKVLNDIEVEDFSIGGGEVEYILILDNLENQAILKTICIITQSDFNINERKEGGHIDISELGFEFAEYWSSSEGFGYQC